MRESLLPANVAHVDIRFAVATQAGALAAFDALRPGDAVVLRTLARPSAALLALRETRTGEFEWTPLVEGPEHWEVEIQKRDAMRGARRRLTEALSFDHERLGALDRAAMEAWGGGDSQYASDLHLRYVHGLRRHIRFEDSVLFPEYERISRTTADRGPTAVMRLEHRAIETLLSFVRAAAARNVPPPETMRSELRAKLYEHEIKEENVLYPMLDRALDRQQADAIVFLFQAMDPAE